MIKYVDERCKEWARGVMSGGPKSTSVIAVMMDGGGLGGSGDGMPLNPNVDEMESIVVKLPDRLKQVVVQQYLGKGNSIENAKALSMSKKKFYDLLDWAHIDIDEKLHP
jgi:hypothetical protein